MISPAPGVQETKSGKAVIRPYVIVDAGHGGSETGHPNVDDPPRPEKVINLEVANMLNAQAAPRMAINMLRRRDQTIPKEKRVKFSDAYLFARRRDFVYVSIHCNGPSDDCPTPAIPTGFEVYYPNGASSQLAQCLAAGMQAAYTELGMSSNRVDAVKGADFVVLKAGKNPHRLVVPGRNEEFNAESEAALVELGFLSNPLQARQLSNVVIQKRLARAIAEGLDMFFCTEERRIDVSGRVRLSNGQPAKLLAYSASAEEETLKGTTKSDGSFRLLLPFMGLWSFDFRARPGVNKGKQFQLRADYERVDLDITLDVDAAAAGANAKGFVFSVPQNMFLGGIKVRALQSPKVVKTISRQIIGDFVLKLPSAGAWDLTFTDPGGQHAVVRIKVTLQTGEDKNIGKIDMR